MSNRSSRHRSRRTAGEFHQLPLQPLANTYRPIEVLSEEQLELIHNGSMRILEELGLEILNDTALRLLESEGADVDWDSKRVRMGRELVMEKVALAPARFILHARNPARNITIGDNHINFSMVSSAPNCSDLDRGRRSGNFEDYCNLLRLGHSFNIIHALSGYPVEPIDLPAATRHLDAYRAFITLTDRSWHAYSLGGGRITDALDMICLARGIDRETLSDEPSIMTVVNTNSPLRVDGPMSDGLMEMARQGQPVVVTPFTLSGAMSPVTLAGALAQQNAEALGAIALTQIVRPGAPIMYGGFTSNVDMKTGAPAFGTPEYARAVLAGGQLARRYRLPYRTSGVNATNCVDAQSAWESEMSLWSAVMSHGNLIKHAAGWLEGGLCASFEKFIVDIEMLQMMSEFLKPFVVNDEELAFDAMREVGPGGHFFGTAHTLARYETAFYAPIVSDWSNFETWRDNGSLTATQRANTLWKQVLADYEEPSLAPDRAEALDAFVERRRREIQQQG